MKWYLYFVLILFSCKTTGIRSNLVQYHKEKAHIYLIKIPPGAQYDVFFDGGTLEINKPRRGKMILQFQISGTVNDVTILASDTGDFKNINECSAVREVGFQTPSNSSIDVTDLRGTFLII